MDVILHTAMAISCMYATYLWGKHLTIRAIYDEVVISTLCNLEKDGFLKTKVDDAGETVIIAPKTWSE